MKQLNHIIPPKARLTTIPAPAFLEKLYDLLSDEAGNQDYITWQSNGTAFLIKQPLESFCNIVLPKYFKHNNLQSFIRQLNMYDFTKTSHDSNHREFTHALFRRGRPDLLCRIKRKISGTRAINRLQSDMLKGNIIEEDHLMLSGSNPSDMDRDEAHHDTTTHHTNTHITHTSSIGHNHDWSQVTTSQSSTSKTIPDAINELTRQVQQLQLQIWMLSDQCDHLQHENHDLRLAIGSMRPSVPSESPDSDHITSSYHSNRSNMMLEDKMIDVDVVRKVSAEGAYLLQNLHVHVQPLVHGQSLTSIASPGMLLSRQASFGGGSSIAIQPSSTSSPSSSYMTSSSTTTSPSSSTSSSSCIDDKAMLWSQREDGLHVIASAAATMMTPPPTSHHTESHHDYDHSQTSTEDGVTTLYRTLSRSLQESQSAPSLTHLHLKRQKTLP